MTINVKINPVGGAPKFPIGNYSYKAILNAIGTADPTPIILNNTFKGQIHWTHYGTGVYYGNLDNQFDQHTTTVETNGIGGPGHLYRSGVLDKDNIFISQVDDSNLPVNEFINQTVTITVKK